MGTNRGAVIDFELEPKVQVGTANDVSGFPLQEGMLNNIEVQFPG